MPVWSVGEMRTTLPRTAGDSENKTGRAQKSNDGEEFHAGTVACGALVAGS